MKRFTAIAKTQERLFNCKSSLICGHCYMFVGKISKCGIDACRLFQITELLAIWQLHLKYPLKQTDMSPSYHFCSMKNSSLGMFGIIFGTVSLLGSLLQFVSLYFFLYTKLVFEMTTNIPKVVIIKQSWLKFCFIFNLIIGCWYCHVLLLVIVLKLRN